MSRVLADELVSRPVTIPAAGRREKDGGAPERPGLYAWWVVGNALPQVYAPPHPSEPDLGLLYIGTAPKREDSAATIRSRILKQHAALGLADSTLRRRLTALLWQERRWTPLLTPNGRWKLAPEEDLALRVWQERTLRVSWVHVAEPWDAERVAIEELQPPLNLAENADHCFYEQLDTARKLFVTVAKARTDQQS